ncbi:potassium channel family protein [Lentilactobacillus kefiri]|uniref:Ion transport 2 domain-containing protein n=2 Tax=Lentilactobacillus kefiri TaxID=33962 RepID=A0A8E1V206_LENKE|nr:potassium channel family protein [Lentilactobacillus kefiri]KRL70399.1 Ion transport 2 domain-containing protein [Lentilactobacillus parakefiri DSM 10551]KRM53034.1 Ion transport 2 domain-containing protein [Lentilactobacillus kefiri DSM 20587 = JCM 5818]MCJ2161877.1 potassium channel family protein [Lentilactobacillus kefiri]MCP9369266.1 potassium channel family protein [Lentilactobacillus kefiri]MDH5108603.1 ion channel [Lentilactobacillus kefiri]
MKQQVKRINILLYSILVVSLALTSFGLAFLALAGKITLTKGPYRVLFELIWLFFLIDYLIRFKQARSKKNFLISNLFDLIALIPSHPIFIFFRIARIYSIVRYYNLLWRFGLSGKLTRALHKFMYDTGFIYLLSISLVILIFSSLIFASFEHDSLQNALWWAISTATTVGYGDVVPKTDGGKIISAVLMLGGIGFLGLLTSTITDFFTTQDKQDDQTDTLKQLTKQVAHLSKQVNQMQKELKKEESHEKLSSAKSHKKK